MNFNPPSALVPFFSIVLASLAYHFPPCQQGGVMSYLLCFCLETWSPAHSLALQTRTAEAQQEDKERNMKQGDSLAGSQVVKRHEERDGSRSPVVSPWQRLFRCVISSCRPVSMARCSCFRKTMPLSTLATCCSSLTASMTEALHNLHTDVNWRS